MNYKNTNTKGLGKLTPKAALAVIRSIRLKAILLLLLAMPYAGFNLYSQNIIYISPYGYGTGSSWQDANHAIDRYCNGMDIETLCMGNP